MKVISDFQEYQILDMKDGEKLENWNGHLLVRPDPQIIWSTSSSSLWNSFDARYERSHEGGGKWILASKKFPATFDIHYKDMVFGLKLMGFKHTGLFPEQAYNWNFLRDKIKESNRPLKVLNLFAYTGAASVACLMEGASVTHIDSSRGMVEWAKENVKKNHLEKQSIRFIVDDVVKFVKREIRRGNHYDIILMDPPSFGRGSKKEVWNIEKDLFLLVQDCTLLLSEDPVLFLINSYSGISKTILENLIILTVQAKYGGKVSSDEIGLPMKDSSLVLPCGMYARWEK